MTPTLRLHQGENEAEYVEHPIEVARKALFAAAELEDEDWAYRLRRVANALPTRTGVRKTERSIQR